MSSQEIKDYTKENEDQRAIVDALDAAEQADPRNTYMFNILTIREGMLDAARIRETAALALLSNCLIAHSSAAQAQAAATAATALPAATSLHKDIIFILNSHNGRVQARKLASLVGTIMPMKMAWGPVTQLYTLNVYHTINNVVSLKCWVSVSDEALNELLF